MQISTTEGIKLVFAPSSQASGPREAPEGHFSQASGPREVSEGHLTQALFFAEALQRFPQALDAAAKKHDEDNRGRHGTPRYKAFCCLGEHCSEAGKHLDNPHDGCNEQNFRAWGADHSEEWSLAAVSRRQDRCLCGRAIEWTFYVCNAETTAVLAIGMDCLRHVLPQLLGDARTLKHYYRTAICSRCRKDVVCNDWLCASCAAQADYRNCAGCGKKCAVSPKFAKHEKCLDCWRQNQLGQSNRNCPRCGEKIPRDKTWWTMCYGCFLKNKGQSLQSAKS